jgi:hypothetical protein
MHTVHEGGIRVLLTNLNMSAQVPSVMNNAKALAFKGLAPSTTNRPSVGFPLVKQEIHCLCETFQAFKGLPHHVRTSKQDLPIDNVGKRLAQGEEVHHPCMEKHVNHNHSNT